MEFVCNHVFISDVISEDSFKLFGSTMLLGTCAGGSLARALVERRTLKPRIGKRILEEVVSM